MDNAGRQVKLVSMRVPTHTWLTPTAGTVQRGPGVWLVPMKHRWHRPTKTNKLAEVVEDQVAVAQRPPLSLARTLKWREEGRQWEGAHESSGGSLLTSNNTRTGTWATRP